MFLSACSLLGCILLVGSAELQRHASSSSLRLSSAHQFVWAISQSLDHSQLLPLVLFPMMFVLLCPAYRSSLKLYEIYVVQDVSITIHSTVPVKPVLGERLLGVKNVEKDSGHNVQLEVAQKLYPAGYILHKISNLGLSSSYRVQGLRTSLIYPISIAHQKQRLWMTFGTVQHGLIYNDCRELDIQLFYRLVQSIHE